MGFSGRKPKEDRTQVRHRNPVHEFREIPDVPFEGHRLPDREGRVGWPASTCRWWETIRRMPHAKEWTPGDWEFAFETAELHARLAERSGGSFTELRQRERLMGTTWDARNSMRIRYVKPSEATKREDAGEVEPAASNVIPFDPAAMYGSGA